MNYTSRRFADITKSFFMVEIQKPSKIDGKLHGWCQNHQSNGCFSYANRYSGGRYEWPQFWFEKEEDAMFFKLTFA
jgi:hypothetical protein